MADLTSEEIDGQIDSVVKIAPEGVALDPAKLEGRKHRALLKLIKQFFIQEVGKRIKTISVNSGEPMAAGGNGNLNLVISETLANELNDKIGSAELETEAQTITEAVNEINYGLKFGSFIINFPGDSSIERFDSFLEAVAELFAGANLQLNTNVDYIEEVATQVLTLPSSSGIYFQGLPHFFSNSVEAPAGAVIKCSGNARINGSGSEIDVAAFDAFVSHTAAGSVWIENLNIKANGVNNVLKLQGGVTAKYYLNNLQITNTSVGGAFGSILEIKRQFEMRDCHFKSPSSAFNVTDGNGTVEDSTLIIDGDEGFCNFVNSSIAFRNGKLIGRNNGTAYDRLIIIQGPGTYIFDNYDLDAGGAQYAIKCLTGAPLPTVILRGNTQVVGEITGVTLVDERTTVPGGSSGVEQRTGTVIKFDKEATYGTRDTPEDDDITVDLTGAKHGVIQKIYHDGLAEPTLDGLAIGDNSGTFKKRSNSGDYELTALNIFYIEYNAEDGTFEYVIFQ